MANSEKFLDKQGVKVLWEEALDTFAEKVDLDLMGADISSLQEDVDALKESSGADQATLDRIDALEGDVAAVDGKISDAIAAVVDGAPEALDTLKEVSDYIASDENRAADMISRIATLEEADVPALTKQEVRDICARVYDEMYLNKYVVADKDEVVNALSKISGSGSITLEENLDLGTQPVNVEANQDLTLDLGGKELDLKAAGAGIQVMGHLTVENGKINATKRAIAAFQGGSITVGEGAEIVAGDCAVTATGAGSEITMNGGSVTAQEAGLLVTTGAKAVMNGGIITGLDNSPIMGNGTKGQGDVNIEIHGGELVANIQSAGYVACGVYMPNSGTLVMDGGKITANGGAGIVARGGDVTVEGDAEIVTTAHPTLTAGKVGDSRVVVECAPIVYDKNSKYPAMDTLKVTVNKNAVLTSGIDKDIQIISDEAEPQVFDNRNA